MSAQTALNQNANLQALLDSFPEEFLHLKPKQQEIAITLYCLLAKGKAVQPQQLSEKANVSIAEIEELFEFGGVYFNENKDIIGFWGLTIEPVGHKFIVEGLELYAWCAWDTLFLPAILGKPAEIHSTCPVSKESIHLNVSPDGIHQVKPASTVISFIKPDPAGIKADVVSNFCHLVRFFKSAKESEDWAKDHPGAFTLSLHEAHKLAHMKNQQRYPINFNRKYLKGK